MLEIIGMTTEDAKIIEDCGADRIELVSALTEGGLTPSFGIIENVTKSVKIPVNVMIRPHSKSFVYSDEEINIMTRDIEIAKSLGVNGVVLGVLDKNNNISEHQLKKLLEKCTEIDVTFNKAIDETNVVKSIQMLNKYNQITNVLTSGGHGNIAHNVAILKEMISESKDINILLGGGLNFDNIENLRRDTKATHFHFGTCVRINNDPFGEINKEKLRHLVDIVNSRAYVNGY